eukprot:TRINITY_DN4610_c0_g1_i2.p1 TRINITY_DN4610_c0_g1~~TRINITY_DN4610_c0_g1_i2.p1  ORF type:complete len:416 (+),score=164.93 TRINITY_DN4610_c0_g1_i2:377-1624(+)
MIPAIEEWVELSNVKEEQEEEKSELQKSVSEIPQQKWDDKMALLIQAYFRKLRKIVNREQDISKIGRNESIIMNCGRIVGGKAVAIKMFYLEETKRIRILLFEKVTKRTQTFILDNVNFTEVNHNELVASAWKIIEKIEYDKLMQQFCIGLEQSENKDQSIGVFSVPQREAIKGKKQKSLRNFEALISHEIYNGIKKTATDYCNVRISLNAENKAEIFILKEKDPLKQRIEVKTDLAEFFKLQPKKELQLKLGRMIYNEIVSTPKGVISFDEDQFREEILKLIFKERNIRLKKIQQKYRSYKLKGKFLSLVAKAKTSRVLVTKFGLKMGRHYHFIKVFTEWSKAGTLAIKSDKASNELKVKIENLDLSKEDDLAVIKQGVKSKLVKSLAFNPAKKALVFRRNANNSRSINNISYI